MPKRWAIALAAAAALVPVSLAQVGGGVNPPALTAVGTGFPVPLASGFAGTQPRFLPGTPILFGSSYVVGDTLPPRVIVQAPPPQVVVVPGAATESREAGKPEALLIELQGDRYVRVTVASDSPRRLATAPDYSGPTKLLGSAGQVTRTELPPVVLVFRDGARQEVRDYIIVGGVLYAGGDYYQDGHWTRPIQVSSLDLRYTFEANEKRGVKFVLPSGPHEVVTRP